MYDILTSNLLVNVVLTKKLLTNISLSNKLKAPINKTLGLQWAYFENMNN